MRRQLFPAFRIVLVFTVLLGLAYPLVVTGVAQGLWSDQADGSLVKVHGKVVGSSLIGQTFTKAKYFHPRPSAAGDGYDGAASGPSNLGPTNPALVDAVKQRIEALRTVDPDNTSPVPVDLVTASGSGLDPHISPAAARYQIARAFTLGAKQQVSKEVLIRDTRRTQKGVTMNL